MLQLSDAAKHTSRGWEWSSAYMGLRWGEGRVMGVWVQDSTWTNIEIIKVQKHPSEGNYMRYSSDQSFELLI